jgi:hypothetical protein
MNYGDQSSTVAPDETGDVRRSGGGHCVRFEAGERQDKAWSNWLALQHLPGSLAQACLEKLRGMMCKQHHSFFTGSCSRGNKPLFPGDLPGGVFKSVWQDSRSWNFPLQTLIASSKLHKSKDTIQVLCFLGLHCSKVPTPRVFLELNKLTLLC